MKILVVEDQLTNRKLLRAQLEAEGFSVVEAGDGVEALHALQGEAVDLVISEILMPNLDGFRLCHEIRTHERLRGLPIILYTSAYKSPADRELASTVGADVLISKPALRAELLEAIRKAMDRSDAPRVAPPTEHDENDVLQRYSAALIRKLEEKNAELESRVEERTRQLADANRELEAFSFTVSHDLRAPLRRIDGFAHVLESTVAGTLDEEGRSALEIILKSVREMSRLISDLLAFSRTSRAELRRERVDLDKLVDGVIASMADELEGRSIVWDRKPLPAVQGDPTLLHQVFVNLLGNAVKYTRPRDPARIEVAQDGSEGDSVVLRIRDNGVGFDPEYADRLFGVFQRLHREDEFEGTGIGLAIVQKVIQRHEGRIWAESTPGEGATFFLTLPAA